VAKRKQDPAAEANRKVNAAAEAKSRRGQRPFPACAFEEALAFAQILATFGSGRPVRRLSLFDHLGKSPESGTSRMLIVNAGKYGLIEGGYQAEQISLTQAGLKAVDDEIPKRERQKARIKLAVEDIPAFNGLYERFRGSKLPAKAALTDAAKELGVAVGLVDEAVDTFIVNVRFVGLLQTLS
jgi:hypothetical protein